MLVFAFVEIILWILVVTLQRIGDHGWVPSVHKFATGSIHSTTQHRNDESHNTQQHHASFIKTNAHAVSSTFDSRDSYRPSRCRRRRTSKYVIEVTTIACRTIIPIDSHLPSLLFSHPTVNCTALSDPFSENLCELEQDIGFGGFIMFGVFFATMIGLLVATFL